MTGGAWGALVDLDVAAEGTEVTPSGLRPPRGPSSTPLLQPASTGRTVPIWLLLCTSRLVLCRGIVSACQAGKCMSACVDIG